MGELVVGLDIGTSKVCTVVGEVREDDIFIVGVGIEPARGMKKGIVSDIEALAAAISESVNKAERSSGYVIDRAFVSVAGDHIASSSNRGMIGITGQRAVNREDMSRVLEAARAIAIPHNREVLHVVPRKYSLDGQERVRSPVGMHGFRLELEAHIITALSSCIANLEDAVARAGLKVDRFVLNALASGHAVLTPEEREMGVVVIDIGGGTTDMAIFIEGTVWHVAVVAVGGHHLSGDITHWVHVPFDEAEAVKLQHGHARRRSVNLMKTFTVQPFGEGLPTEVHCNELAEVLEYRTTEIFELVQREIRRTGYDGFLRAGAVLTGGSSQLPGMRSVAEETLGLPVRMAQPEKLTGMADALRDPAFSTGVGLLGLGLEMEVAEARGTVDGSFIPGEGLGNWLGGLFRRLLPESNDPG